MSFSKPIVGLLIVSVCSFSTKAQQTDSALLYSDPYIAELDSLLAQSDSTSILSLIDSLINLPEPELHSQLNIRLGYNSNVVSASRTLGFNQFGMAPGLSYYHKSGLYTDVTGYWSKEYDPQYYLTVGTVGYMNSPTAWWSVMAEYNRYFYSAIDDETYIAYDNTVGIYNFFNAKWFTFRLDYQLFFGEKVAHRINPTVMINLEKRGWGKIDRIAFYPYSTMLFGSEQITRLEPYVRSYLGIIYRLRRGLPLYYEVTNTEWGVLNYSFVAPVSISMNRWTFMISYTYNIPQALPGETIDLINSGYLSASISKLIQFK